MGGDVARDARAFSAWFTAMLVYGAGGDCRSRTRIGLQDRLT